MMKYTFLSACLAATAAALCNTAARADVLAYQGFEGGSTDTWAYTSSTVGAGTGAPGNQSPSTDFPAGSRIREGAYSFQSNNTASTLVFSTIHLDAGVSAYISIPIASISLTSGNGNDVPDYVAVFIALNGEDFSQTPDLKLTGYSNAKWSYAATGVAEILVGDASATVTKTPSSIQYGMLRLNLPENVSSVAMKLVLVNDNSGEIWATDGISLTSVPEASSLSLLALGGLLLSCRMRGRTA